MTRHRLTSNGFLAALILAACGAPSAPAPPPPPPSLDRDLPQLVARSLALYLDVAAALTAHPADCAATTAALHALAGRHREVVVANAKVIADGRSAELRAALAPRDAELDAAAAAVMQAPAMSACAPEPAFAHALDALFAP